MLEGIVIVLCLVLLLLFVVLIKQADARRDKELEEFRREREANEAREVALTNDPFITKDMGSWEDVLKPLVIPDNFGPED